MRSNFNPRPHTGATVQRPSCVQRVSNFNPRPHTGATTFYVQDVKRALISIHAPIRGRLYPSFKVSCGIRFQSTPPYGGDFLSIQLQLGNHDFNPRPHTGATGHPGKRPRVRRISIHAPIRGRREGPVVACGYLRFQSTPPYGGDRSQSPGWRWGCGFQSTPPYGGDPQSRPGRWTLAISIHAPIRGRRLRPDHCPSVAYFNPRPHTGATWPS